MPDYEVNLHESLEKLETVETLYTLSSSRVFRPVSNVIVAGHATAGAPLTRIYDAAWPRARLMRQTYVWRRVVGRGCGRASASGADRVCHARICRSKLSRRSPILVTALQDIPTRGTRLSFDESIRRVLIGCFG